jgi:hypothetical protein
MENETRLMGVLELGGDIIYPLQKLQSRPLLSFYGFMMGQTGCG